MRKSAKLDNNPAINPTDIAVALKKAWTKSCGERPLDTRDHVLACSREGNENAAGAFLDAAGDAWWVPLFRDRTEASGQAVLETPIQEESDLEHYLEVAALVPSLRDTALDRFEQAATSWVEALPQGHYTQGMHIGRFAELAPGRARSFVARFPALLEPRGVDSKGRQPATHCVARLLSESFAETMPLVATLKSAVVTALPEPRYELSLSAEEWIELTRAATKAQEYGVEWLLGQMAHPLSKRTDKSFALTLFDAADEPDEKHLQLLIELGRIDQAKHVLEKLADVVPASQLARAKYQLGLIDAKEARQQLTAHLTNPKFKTQQELAALLRLTEVVGAMPQPDVAVLERLAEDRAALVELGDGDSSGAWAEAVLLDAAQRFPSMDAAARKSQSKALGLLAKKVAGKERRGRVAPSVRALASIEPTAALALAKTVPPAERSMLAMDVSRGFLPTDPGGALEALCGLCPKQASRPGELVPGTFEILSHVLATA